MFKKISLYFTALVLVLSKMGFFKGIIDNSVAKLLEGNNKTIIIIFNKIFSSNICY